MYKTLPRKMPTIYGYVGSLGARQSSGIVISQRRSSLGQKFPEHKIRRQIGGLERKGHGDSLGNVAVTTMVGEGEDQ